MPIFPSRKQISTIFEFCDTWTAPYVVNSKWTSFSWPLVMELRL